MSKYDEMNTCKVCGDLKFPQDMKLVHGYILSTCKDCFNEQQRKKRAEGDYDKYKGKYKERLKNWKLNREYGITLAQFESKLKYQFNGCAICKEEFKDRTKIHVDHNHETNKVRDLLCTRCNLVLGLLHEDEDLIWEVLEYLKRHESSRNETNSVVLET